MEVVAASLTAILLVFFQFHCGRGARIRARQSAGTLLLALKPAGWWRSQWIGAAGYIGAAVLLFMFCLFRLDHDFVIFAFGSPLGVFIWMAVVLKVGVLPLLLRPEPQLCQRGIVVWTGCMATVIPWHRIKYCKWAVARGKLLVQCDAFRVFRIHLDQIETASEMLGRFVELRDVSGTVLNPDVKSAYQLAQSDSPTEDVKPFRMQFSLRTLLLLMLVASAGFSWLGIRMRRTRTEEAVIAGFDRFGPKVDRIAGQIWGLDFSGCKTKPTDDDLARLKELSRLAQLDLSEAPITDAGLAHLDGMTSLKLLNLHNTQVTDEGVRQLQQALPDVWISH